MISHESAIEKVWRERAFLSDKWKVSTSNRCDFEILLATTYEKRLKTREPGYCRDWKNHTSQAESVVTVSSYTNSYSALKRGACNWKLAPINWQLTTGNTKEWPDEEIEDLNPSQFINFTRLTLKRTHSDGRRTDASTSTPCASANYDIYRSQVWIQYHSNLSLDSPASCVTCVLRHLRPASPATLLELPSTLLLSINKQQATSKRKSSTRLPNVVTIEIMSNNKRRTGIADHQSLFVRQSHILRKNIYEWDQMLRSSTGEDWPSMLGRLNAAMVSNMKFATLVCIFEKPNFSHIH